MSIHPYNLETIHTRELLSWLAGSRACGHGAFDPTGNGGPMVDEQEIRDELATREHIPNKAQARRIRQKRAMK